MCKQPSSVHFTPQYTETLRTHVRESLQMQFKVAVRNFLMAAGDSLTCMLVVTITMIVVVR